MYESKEHPNMVRLVFKEVTHIKRRQMGVNGNNNMPVGQHEIVFGIACDYLSLQNVYKKPFPDKNPFNAPYLATYTYLSETDKSKLFKSHSVLLDEELYQNLMNYANCDSHNSMWDGVVDAKVLFKERPSVKKVGNMTRPETVKIYMADLSNKDIDSHLARPSKAFDSAKHDTFVKQYYSVQNNHRTNKDIAKSKAVKPMTANKTARFYDAMSELGVAKPKRDDFQF